ncbi:MAG: DUF2490 domain-containing protein [Candidatus Omnitrophica bacterium]|nr:DUF2490 domain-containing protein [Candidatus Omnitrophota bacterium]
MRKIIGLILAILFFSNYSFAFDDGDFQYWNAETIAWKASEDWKVSLDEIFRFGDNAGTLYYEHSEIGTTYSGLSSWLDIKMGYRQAFSIKKDRWKYENMPNASVTIKLDMLNLNFTDRNKIEYRNIQDKDDNWRYRNKFTVTLPKLTSFEIQPYVADEIFVDLSEGEFNRNRLYAGASLKLIKNLKFDLYYLLQTSKSKKDWINYNIIGTKLKISF